MVAAPNHLLGAQGSEGRERARSRLARTHRKVPTPDGHLVHQASGALVTRCRVLAIEDLNVRGMVSNRHLARAISDAAMGEISRQIMYKAKWLINNPGWPAGSSQVPRPCESKGCTHNLCRSPTPVGLSYCCTYCGLVIDRGLNAEINLTRWQPEEPPAAPRRKLLLSTALSLKDLHREAHGKSRSSPAQPSRHRDEGPGSEPRIQMNDCRGSRTGSKHHLSHLVQLVKANRWVKIGHALLGLWAHISANVVVASTWLVFVGFVVPACD